MAGLQAKETASDKFRIAIIGSGPIGKLLACSAVPHPRIELVQYEQDVLPLRPAFGYGVGPQTLIAAKILNSELGDELLKRCYTSKVWMRWWHGGTEDRLITDVEVPEGKVFGRLGREELMTLLDELLPEGMDKNDIQYGKRLESVTQLGPNELQLAFQDGTTDLVNAVWAADGVNSMCRSLVQKESFRPPSYTGFQVYRGKVAASKVAKLVGEDFAAGTYMFVGVKGWHVLIFPIDNNTVTNVAAFCMVPDQKKFSRDDKVTIEELLGHFPERSSKIDTILRLVQSETPGGIQRLQVTHMEKLERLFNPELCMTTFGDAANAMTPHIAGSMSCGVIGCTTFLHQEWNPRIRSGTLSANATNEEIATALSEASFAYEKKHLPLAQQLVDISAEQGPLWSGGITNIEELKVRPLILWNCADSMNKK